MNRLRALLAWIVNHAVVIIVTVGLITAFFGLVIVVKGVPETKNPTEKVLIKDLDSTKFYNKFVGMFGKDELILIVVKAPEGKTVFDPEVRMVIEDITARLNGVADTKDKAYAGVNARVQDDIKRRLIKAGQSEEEATAEATKVTPVTKVLGLAGARKDLESNISKIRLAARLSRDTQIRTLAEALKNVKTKEDVDRFFEQFVERIKLFKNNLVSKNLEATTITLIIGSHAEDVVGYVREIVAAANEQLGTSGRADQVDLVYQIGSPVIADEVVQFLKDDLKTLSGFTLGLIVIILAVCFRNVRGVVLPLVSAGIAYVWTFGLMSLMGAYLNMITVVIPTLLIAIGNAYALHVVSEFFEEAGEGHRTGAGRRLKREIVTSTLFRVSLPVFLAGATTLIGFGSLALNRIDMIREFAFFSCFGLVALILLSLTLLPALLAVLPLPKQRTKSDDHTEESLETKRSPVLSFLRWLHRLDVKGQVFVYIAAVLVIALCIAGLFQLKVENAVISFFKKDAEVRMSFNDIQEVMAGCYTVNVVMEYKGPGDEPYFQDPAVLRQIEALQQRVVEGDPGIDMAISLVEYLKMTNAFMAGFRYDKQSLPETRKEIAALVAQFPNAFGPDQTEIRQVATKDYQAINIIFRAHFEGAREFVIARDEILRLCGRDTDGLALRKPPPDAVAFSKDLDIHVTGLPLVVSESANAITKGQVSSLALAFICIFVIMAGLFMSVKVGFVAMIPNVFPILINYGIMGWAGIALSSATSLIASIALGIAVDDTIHYLARYNTEFKKDFDKKRAMKMSLLTAGQPIVFTSITLGIAFAVLLVSKFQPTIYFGLLMMITMVTALFGSLIILPVLMLRIELVTLWDVVSQHVGEAPRAFINLFRNMSRWQVRKVMAAAGLQCYPKGTTIVKEGEVGDTMYAIISGAADVIRGEGSNAHQVARLERGQIFGEMALVLKEPRTATVVTTEDTELLRFNDKTLRRIRGRFPRLAAKLYRNLTFILGRRLKLTTDRLHDALGPTLSGVPPEEV
ncbi:MAG: MMPL family transporter [Verrucomicrobia bacterium]|nr:MMPL family transporter [Verrucomicrobiota bacterium]